MDLWTKNSAKYPTVKMLLNKFDPLCEHPLRTDKNLRAETQETLTNLTSLERHFRLANGYLKRDRAIREL